MEGRSQQINQGLIETKNLSECLKVDFAVLYRSIFPKGAKSTEKAIQELQSLGISKRMDAVADLLVAAHSAEELRVLDGHCSDTARSWAAFIVGKSTQKSLSSRLEAMKKFADDSHFGVREWAWIAVRKHVSADVTDAIQFLSSWTKDPSPRVRRFACEATRPRGVWAEHIQILKDNPELGLHCDRSH